MARYRLCTFLLIFLIISVFSVRVAQALILDNFNRPDGPIGGNWTVQNASFVIVNNAAQGGQWALATYNGASSNIVEADVVATGIDVQYVGLVLGYADINNNIFVKVQQQNFQGTFDHAACYIGNNGNSGTFGLGFFPLSSPFTSAHMKAELSGNTVTITFSNIDGGSGTQTYVCNGAPNTGSNGIGIASYTINAGRIDNFAAQVQQQVAVPTMNKWGLIIFITLVSIGGVYYLRKRRYEVDYEKN